MDSVKLTTWTVLIALDLAVWAFVVALVCKAVNA